MATARCSNSPTSRRSSMVASARPSGDPAGERSSSDLPTFFAQLPSRRDDRMTWRFGRLALVALFALAAWGIALSHAQAQGRTSPLATGLDKEFASETATVN